MQTRQSIDIAAPPGTIWAVLTHFDAWPRWQKAVARARLDGALAKGSVLHWKAGGLSIRSVLTEVAAPHSLAWEGRSLGGHAVHRWRIEPHGNGARVTSDENMRGWLVSLIGLFQPDFLDKALATALTELMTASEAEAAQMPGHDTALP